MTTRINDATLSIGRLGSGLVLPIDTSSVAFLFLFGGDLSSSCRNWIDGQPAGTLAGATLPTANASDVLFTSASNWIQSPMADSVESTLITVAMAVADATTVLISNASTLSQSHTGGTAGNSMTLGVGTAGDNLVNPGYNRARVVSGATANDSVGLSTPVSVGSFSCLVARYGAVDYKRRIDNLTASTSAVSAVGHTEPPDLGQPLRVGSSAESYNVGQNRQILAFGANRRLSDAEVSTLYLNFIKPYCAKYAAVVI